MYQWIICSQRINRLKKRHDHDNIILNVKENFEVVLLWVEVLLTDHNLE
jgi:hypothetical protein